MSGFFSVSHYPSGDRPDALRTALSSSLMGVNVHVSGRMSATMRRRDLGASRLFLESGGAAGGSSRLDRTPRLVSAADDASLILVWPISGSYVVERADDAVRVGAGQWVCHDTVRPQRLVFPDDHRLALLRVPRSSAELPARTLDRVGLTPAREGGAARLLRLMVNELVLHPENGVDGAAQEPVGQALIELARAAFLERLGDDGHPRCAHTALRKELHVHIQRNFRDPDLSPGSVAAAHSISVRQLQRVYAEQATTFMAELRRYRLRTAAGCLRSPAYRTRSIEAIAASCGFTNPAHFSRAFKVHYGVSPRRWRSSE